MQGLALSSKPGQPRAGDWTHSLPVEQLRVAQNSEVDMGYFADIEAVHGNKNLIKPFGECGIKDMLGVVAGEICMSRVCVPMGNKELYRSKRLKPLPSNLTKGFTQLNGMYVSGVTEADWKALSIAQRRELLHKQFRITGIVGTTREWPEISNLGRTDFANDIGGIRGIINTSTKENIYAGNLVIAQVPEYYLQDEPSSLNKRPMIAGTDSTKILLETVPYDPSRVISTESLRENMKDLTKDKASWDKRLQFGGGVGTKTALTESTIEDFLNNLVKFEAHVAGCTAVNTAVRAVVPPAVVDHATVYKTAVNDFLRYDAVKSARSWKLIVGLDDTGVNTISSYLTGGGDDDYLRLSQSALPNLLQGFYKVLQEENKKVLGVAMTDAVPGQQFDIKIGSYCMR
jgi:hypothetical protein